MISRPRTGPLRSPPAPGPCGPGRCWSSPPRRRPRCGPGGSASRRRPGSGWSPRCRASCRPCAWTRPSPCPSAWRRTPLTRCVPGWPTGTRSATGPAGSPSGPRSAPSALGMAGQVAYHLLAQAGAARAPWPVTMIVSCLPVLVLAMGTALAHMLRADAHTTADGQDHAGTTGPVASWSSGWSTGYQAGPAQDHNTARRTSGSGPPADRTRTVPAAVRSAAGGTRTPPLPETDQARLIASRLSAAGRRVSRRALRSEGIKGSNQALNTLAARINAELANTAVVPARPGNAVL